MNALAIALTALAYFITVAHPQEKGVHGPQGFAGGEKGIVHIASTNFPDASTTGVPAGTTLTEYTGPMTITEDGTVIENQIINGSLRVTADNVTIKNCKIDFTGYWGVDAEGAQNLTIQDCDITGPGYAGTSNAAILGGGTFLRNDISKAENGIVLQGTAVVKGNYIHDLENSGSDPHYDGISVQGGQDGVVIEGNTILARDTSDIIINNNFGPVNDVTIKDNFLGGDVGINIYIHDPETTNVEITGNYLAKGGYDFYSIYQTSPNIHDNIELPNGTLPSDVEDAPMAAAADVASEGVLGFTDAADAGAEVEAETGSDLSAEDTVSGGDEISQQGDDLLVGENGQDSLTGSSGGDVLVGDDYLIYDNVSDSDMASALRDWLANPGADDRIDLTGIDANQNVSGDQAFTFDEDGSFSAGEIQQSTDGSNVLVQMNVDVDANAEISILISNHSAFENSDFVF